MIIKANIAMAFYSLVSAKQRNILALLGIVIGIVCVIAIVSIGSIVRENNLKQFEELGIDYVVVFPGWSGFGSDSPKISFKNAVDLANSVRSVSASTPLGSGGVYAKINGFSFSTSLMATAADFLKVNRIKLKEGRYISDLDLFMPYCVVGLDVVKELEKAGVFDPIGAEINFKDRLFTVVGVLENVPNVSMRPFNANKSIIIPFSTYERTFEEPEVSNVIVRTSPGVEPDAVTEDIKNFFDVRQPGLDIEVQTSLEIIEARNKVSTMLTMLLFGIGSVALVVGAIGVVNVMLVSVSERRKEIGIRRALGALRRDIQFQFLVEAIVLCLIGGILGAPLGLGAAYLFTLFFDLEFFFSGVAVLLGVGVSSAVGIIAGYYPARQAARLDPIIALRAD